MVQLSRPPRNGFNRVARRIYNPLGFSKAYNFILWFIFSGAMLGFLAARAPFLDFHGVFCGEKYVKDGLMHAGPGECWKYFTDRKAEYGIKLHLRSIIPAGFLALLQFTPAIRHKIILFHRICGYTALILVFFAHAGAIIVAPVAFGGTFETQVFIGAVVIVSTIYLIIAYINIKRLQIEQHRAFMLRAWFYMACIITQRLIIFTGAQIITRVSTRYMPMPCGKIENILDKPETVIKYYPTCAGGSNGTIEGNQTVLVQALWNGRGEQKAATLDMMFGGALWLALLLHAIGVELYLRLTPAETARLRKVSYERQLARGMRNPGSAGITADRFGDGKAYQPCLESETLMDPSRERLRHKDVESLEDDTSDTSYRGASY